MTLAIHALEDDEPVICPHCFEERGATVEVVHLKHDVARAQEIAADEIERADEAEAILTMSMTYNAQQVFDALTEEERQTTSALNVLNVMTAIGRVIRRGKL